MISVSDAWRRGALAMAGVALTLLVLGWFALTLTGGFGYSVFTDRDLMRAWTIFSDFEVSGAEFAAPAGARVPGNALYLIWGSALALNGSPVFVMAVQLALTLVATAALALVVARRFGAVPALVAATLALGGGLVVDAASQLWNPGMAPPFILTALALLLAAVHDRRPWLLPAAVLAIAIGAQMHLGVWWLGSAVAAALVVERRFRRPAVLVACLAAVVLAYAPFLLAEAAQGFPRLGLILRTPFVQEPLLLPEAGYWGQLPSWLLLGEPRGWPSRLGPWGELALVGLPLAGLALLPAALARRTLAAPILVILTPAVAAFVTYGLNPTYAQALSDPQNGRYLLVPAACLGLAGALAWTPRPAMLAAAVLVLTFAAASLALLLGGKARHWGPSHAALSGLFSEVAAAAGWDLAEVHARMRQVFRDCPGGAAWCSPTSDAFLHGVARAGAGPVGIETARAPCALVVEGGLPQDGRIEPILTTLLGDGASGARLVERMELRPDRTLVLYDLPGGTCPSSFSNRFLLPPEERITLERFDAFWFENGGRSVTLADTADGRSFLVGIRCVPRSWIDCAPGALAHLTVSQSEGQLTADLHANQLRGMTGVSGFFGIALLDDLALVLTGQDGVARRLPLAAQRVGAFGLFAPLRATAPTPPPGSYRLELEATVLVDPARLLQGPVPLQREPRRVLVTDQLPVGPGQSRGAAE